MKVIHCLKRLPRIKEKTYITFGNFDGFHAGHRLVINRLVNLAKRKNGKSMVITFKNHFNFKQDNQTKASAKEFKVIFPPETKREVLAQLNIDYLLILDFEEIRRLEYFEFLDLILEKIHLAGLIASDKLRFGYQKKGTPQKVAAYFNKKSGESFFLSSIKKLKDHLSSTMIRSFLSEGKIYKANQKLIVPFHIIGKVTAGKKVGRKIGFPTINFPYPKEIIRLPSASYITLTVLGGKIYPSMSFVGVPFGNNRFMVETHLLNFSKTVYNNKVEVYFIKILEEKKFFKDISLLKAFLNKQLEKVVIYFEKNQQNIQIEKIYNFIKNKSKD